MPLEPRSQNYLLKGFFFLLLALFLLVAATYVGYWYRTQQIPITPSVEEQTSNYCPSIQAETLKYKSLKPPDDYIALSDNERLLGIWKELFIRNNGISEGYFNDHIRVFSDSKVSVPHGETLGWDPNPNLDEYFEVRYNFIVDWLNLSMRDGFIIKYVDSDYYLTKEEIVKIAGDLSRPVVTRSWEISIGYIRDNNGTLIENVISCDTAVEKLTSLLQALIPTRLSLRPFAQGLELIAQGKTGPNTCPTASVNLTGGETYLAPDQPCFIP